MSLGEGQRWKRILPQTWEETGPSLAMGQSAPELLAATFATMCQGRWAERLREAPRGERQELERDLLTAGLVQEFLRAPQLSRFLLVTETAIPKFHCGLITNVLLVSSPFRLSDLEGLVITSKQESWQKFWCDHTPNPYVYLGYHVPSTFTAGNFLTLWVPRQWGCHPCGCVGQSTQDEHWGWAWGGWEGTAGRERQSTNLNLLLPFSTY